MCGFSTVGSQVQLTFQTKFQTFTADQFNRALKDKNYLMTQGQINTPQPPQQFIAQIFSKENLNVFINPTTNQIFFQILNTVNPLVLIENEIKQILISLNVVQEVIFSIIFNCTTTVYTDVEPVKSLTGLLNPDLLNNISNTLNTKLTVASIKLSTSYPLEGGEGIQLILEPLATNPKKQYFVTIVHITNDMDKFDSFIRKFGDKLVQEIIGQVIKKNV